MSGYIKGVLLEKDFPDLPLVGYTFIHMADIPKKFSENPTLLEDLKEELNEIANEALSEFHEDIITETHTRKGSLIVDVFFNCELQTLISVDNLKLLGLWGEARGGLLGILSRLYDASDVCQGSSSIQIRAASITTIKNSLKTINEIMTRNEDRSFMCQLLKPIITNIPDSKDIDKSKDSDSANKYQKSKEESLYYLDAICKKI